MSLDVNLTTMSPVSLYAGNITHNLVPMAKEAGIYKHLWRPEEIGITKAKQLIEPLTNAAAMLRADPARFRQHNPANGWGTYEDFVAFVVEYLRACIESPGADVSVSR